MPHEDAPVAIGDDQIDRHERREPHDRQEISVAQHRCSGLASVSRASRKRCPLRRRMTVRARTREGISRLKQARLTSNGQHIVSAGGKPDRFACPRAVRKFA